MREFNTTSWRLGLTLVTVAMLATACGPDANNAGNEDDNNKTTVDMGTDDGGDNPDDGGDDPDDGGDDPDDGGDDPDDGGNDPDDGGDDPDDGGDDPDMGEDMADMNMEGTDVAEVEPNDNPAEDALTPFNTGDTITGNIAAYDADADISDIDIFQVTLSAGDVFEWTVDAGTGFSADGIFTSLSSPEGADVLVRRNLFADSGVVTRQAFVPADGVYEFVIADLSAFAQDGTVPHGGADATYSIATRAGTLSPQAITPPGSESGDLSDGNVDTYSFTWSTDSLFSAEVLAARAPIESDLDPVLSVWDVAAGEIVITNDDINADDDNFDSGLTAALENGKEYYIVVDGWNVGTGTEYQLDTTEADDSPDAPTVFAAGDTISGEIAEFVDGGTADVDYFAVTLSAGDVFKWTIDSSGADFSAEGIFVSLGSPEGQMIPLRRNLRGTDSTNTREAFIPEDGVYQLIVADFSAFSADGAVPHGGADAGYSISTSKTTISASALTVPGTQPGDLSDGNVDVYSFSSAEAYLLEAEVFASREPTTSTLDSVLALWDADAGQLIAFNDDVDANANNFDSIITQSIDAGTNYLLVVDGWNVGDDTGYELRTKGLDDAPSAPTIITIGQQNQGVISEADATAETVDTDYFQVTAQPGETIKIDVNATNPALTPQVDVLVDTGFFGFQVVASGTSVEGLASVSFNNPTGGMARDYFVLVNDATNLPADENDDPDYVGGADFTYTLDSNLITWTPVDETLPLSIMSTYSAPGEYAWYKVDVVEDSIVTLSATSTSATPVVSWFDAAEGVVSDETLVYLPGAAGERIFGTRDAEFRGNNGATTFDFDFTATSYEYGNVTFAASNENTGNNEDQTLPEPLTVPAAVTGVTQQGANSTSDFFSVSAVAGEKIIVFTEADPNAPLADPADPTSQENADTIITVYDDAGTELGQNDDLVTDGLSLFSALVIEAPTSGVYTIEVASFGASSDGNYVLKAFTQP